MILSLDLSMLIENSFHARVLASVNVYLQVVREKIALSFFTDRKSVV